MEKQYRLKRDVVKYVHRDYENDICSHPIWIGRAITIEALEEVKPKRVELYLNEYRTSIHTRKSPNLFSYEELNACEFMLNKLLPYGVKDEESLDELAWDWFNGECKVKSIGDSSNFTDWLKEQKKCDGCKRAVGADSHHVYTCNCNVE